MRYFALTLCLAACLAVPTTATAAVSVGDTGWVWANPLPQGDNLDAIAFHGSLGVAAGAGGLILRSGDAGASWSAVASATDADLTEVAIPDANTVYVGGGCVLRRSTDAGLTFTRVRFGASETKCSGRIAEIAFPSSSVGYVILTDGRVLRTANGGRSFAQRASLGIGSSVPQGGPADADFTGEDTGVISTGLWTPSFVRTADGGRTWTPIVPRDAGGGPTLNRVLGVKFVTPSLGYAVADGSSARLGKTEDGGLTWSPLPLAGATSAPKAIDCVDAATCVILAGGQPGGPGGGVIWTADGGLTGTPVPLSAGLSDLAFSTPTRVVGVGPAGATLASDDAGHSFARVGGILPGLFTSLRQTGDRAVVAFARDGALARSADGGLTWQALGSTPLNPLADVSFVSATVGYILSADGALGRTDDGGASWEVLDGQAGGRALLATGPGALLVASASGVLRSTDGGASFAVAAGARRAVQAFDRAGSALVAYGRKAILVSTDAGSSWRTLSRPRGDVIGSADFVSPKVGFVVRDDGELVATAVGGRSWRLVTGVGRDDVTQVSFGDAKHGFLLLGDDPDLGGVLRTSDGGRSWRPQVIAARPLAGMLASGKLGGVAVGTPSGQLFATSSGGDAGARSALTLRLISKRRQGRRTVVTVGGRLKPAPAGAGVAVTARIGGTWVRKFARVTPRGRFRTTWKLRRSTVLVAQWRGAAGVRADGTPPLRIRLGGHRHR